LEHSRVLKTENNLKKNRKESNQLMKKLLLLITCFLFSGELNIVYSKTIDLEYCVFYSEGPVTNSSTYFDASKYMYENSTWSINPETRIISNIENFKDEYIKNANKDAMLEEYKIRKTEISEFKLINYTPDLVIGRTYVTKLEMRELLIDFNARVTHKEVIINLKKNLITVLTLPDGPAPWSYEIVNRMFQGNFSYDQFQKMFKTKTISYICGGNSLEQEKEDIAKNKSKSGTAFFINSKGFLLTNNHVVEGCKLQQVKYNDKDYEAKIIATDKTLDLALMKIEAKPKNYLNFSESSPEKLQKVYVAGYPFGKGLSDDLKISSGIVSSVKGYDDNSNEFQVDAPINPGNSGGPIVDDTGELIGIAVAGLAKDKSEGINFGIKSLSAVTFLKTNNIDPETSIMTFGMNNKKLLQLLEESTVYTYCN
jgi:S1-C subfamily serine protease